MKKAYASFDELMWDVYRTIGIDLAPDYDVYAIADALYSWEGDDMVADLERDDFWLIVAEHDLTKDWRDMVELPAGVDADVDAIINAGYYVVDVTTPTVSTLYEWFDVVCHNCDVYEVTAHMVTRAKRLTTEWRNAATPLNAEGDRLEAWYEARRLCQVKGVDVTDSRCMCRALHIVESDPSWLFNYTLSLFDGNVGESRLEAYEI